MTASAYAVLGVSPESEDVVIRAAYRALMQKYTSLARLHEDVGADDRRAREVQAAYDAIEAARRAPAEAAPLLVFRSAPEPPPTVEPALADDVPDEAPAPCAGLPHAPRRRSAGPALIALTLVVAAGGAVAWWAARPRATRAEDAARPALQVRLRPAAGATPLARPLPCFVNGHAVGELRLADCAARNGVASGPLELGVAPPAASGLAVQAPALAPTPAPPPVRMAAVRPASPRPSLAGLDADMARPLQALIRAAKASRPGPSSAQPRRPDEVDHIGHLLTLLTPLAHSLMAKAQEAVSVRPAEDAPAPERPAAEAPRAVQPRPPAADVEVPIAAPIGPAREAEPAQATRSETLAVVRSFYQALGERDAAGASALIAPEQRDAGPLSADRLRRFSSSVRQPVRVTGIRAVDDGTVAVRYQFVSAANQLCEGVASVATTQLDDRVLIRGIHSTYAC